MKEKFIHSYNCFTPFGNGLNKNISKILANKTAIKKLNNGYFSYFGSLIEDEKINYFDLDDSLSRLEKMMIITLKDTLKDNKSLLEKPSTGLIISTTKGNISQLLDPPPYNSSIYLSSIARSLKKYFKAINEPLIISNACVSGTQAISVASRLIEMKLYKDIVIVGGDEISLFISSGFEVFKALGSTVCKPFSSNRDGISLGEATASLIVSNKDNIQNNSFQILSSSNINDTNHISGPSRTGEGLYHSIQNSTKKANLEPKDINFISAHGTATIFNDEMESIAFNRAEIQKTPLNSLKGYFGHTLGAAGLLESIISFEMINNNYLFATYNFDNLGTSLPINVISENKKNYPIDIFLKTSSGFGGTNSAIIFRKI